MWGIAFKPDPKRPETMSGKLFSGRSQIFPTKKLADAFIASVGDDQVHAVETDGGNEPVFPNKE